MRAIAGRGPNGTKGYARIIAKAAFLCAHFCANFIMLVDLFEFTRQAQHAHGETSVAALARVEALAPDGLLTWSAEGSMHGRHGAPRLDLKVDGDVPLLCQRCMQPLRQPVHVDTRFLVATGEAEAEALDQDDDYDVVVGSASFDLDALIEDEVILALPSAPRHVVCPTAAPDPVESGRPSPFAALAALKLGNSGSDAA
jgi:uncharacterized protein